ncbi:hypothetical protein JXB02_00225 [Candidatus Woesearchaeota archaeon]|nr:hypothetical protein [Candidatus Woesearchaeota archaeon]
MPEIRIPEQISELFPRYHDRILADDSIPDIDVLLFSIFIHDYQKKSAGIEYDECKRNFIYFGRKEDAFRKMMHLAKSKKYIKVTGSKINLSIKGIKRLESRIGAIGKSRIHIIKAGESFTAVKIFEEFLSSEINGDVKLCDPYISPETLFPFLNLKGKIKSIQILTANIFNKEKFDSYINKFKKELGISVEIKENKKIHDRYIITDNSCWWMGTSIKDLGNKDTIIQDISVVKKSMDELFSERWEE